MVPATDSSVEIVDGHARGRGRADDMSEVRAAAKLTAG